MYNDLVTDDTVMNLLIKEQENVTAAEEKLDYMQVKKADFINQCEGFKSSLVAHEANLKKVEAQLNAMNRSLEENEGIARELNDSTKELVKKVNQLRKQVSVGETNLKKILEQQTNAFLTLENVDDEKVELEQKQEEQKKLILDAPPENNAGFFEKIKQRRKTSLLQGELDKLSNQIQNKQTKEQEVNAEIERLIITRKEQDLAIRNDMLMIANMEKTILQNGEILLAHSANVEKLRTATQEVALRHRIVTDKVTNLREQILEKQYDIAGCTKQIKELEQTLAKLKANIVEKRKTHAEMSDKVTVGIVED